MPEIRLVVVEAQAYAARYASCGERSVGEAPDGLEWAGKFGPCIEAPLAYLHYAHHLSHERPVAV